MSKNKIGTLYLLHFERPLSHARHYLGFVRKGRTPEERLEDHRSGRGAKMTAAAALAGIAMLIVWTAPGTRTDERRIKTRRAHARICPICRKRFLKERLVCRNAYKAKTATRANATVPMGRTEPRPINQLPF